MASRRARIIRVATAQFLVASLIVSSTSAQNRRGSGGDTLLKPGTQLPVVTAYDEAGDEFSTASLRGKHTVLVFGCLT
ncbi:MAG: hypothetical protein HKN47_27295 [Pirellulaceae bacterium]|nr:hypothetical protein [Pirellulaceae bacterium]